LLRLPFGPGLAIFDCAFCGLADFGISLILGVAGWTTTLFFGP
jgi:hypothetical protein